MARSKSPALQEGLSGVQVGQMMIRDLCTAYMDDEESTPLLTEAEKRSLVAGLSKPADIRAYNDYRYAHEYLVQVPTYLLLQEQIAETAYWKLFHPMTNLMLSESENAATDRTAGALHVEMSAHPFWRAFMAEDFLDTQAEYISADLAAFCRAIRECHAVRKAVELLGDLLGVPQVKGLLFDYEATTVYIQNYNMLRDRTLQLIDRSGMPNGNEEQLREQLTQLLPTIDPDALRPTQEAIDKARAQLDISMVRGGARRLYALLRGEA